MLLRSTGVVSEPKRFDFWREAICETFVDLAPRRRDQDDDRPFFGELAGGQIGDIRFCTVSASPHEVIRSPGLIKRTGGDFLFVSLLLDGNMVCAQDDRVAELVQRGQLVLYDSAKPYLFAFREPSRQLVVRIPREQFSHRLHRVGKATALTVGGNDGVGALASRLLRSLAEHVHDVDPQVTRPLLSNVLDVLSAAFVPGDRTESEPAEHRAVHLRRAYECIRRRHVEPGLTPAQVAGEIGVSERYLFALFREAGTSPAKAIMNERLIRAHAALAQPKLHTGTVEGLALSLGFKQATHFTRAFKERYGLPPSHHRERALAESSGVAHLAS